MTLEKFKFFVFARLQPDRKDTIWFLLNVNVIYILQFLVFFLELLLLLLLFIFQTLLLHNSLANVKAGTDVLLRCDGPAGVQSLISKMIRLEICLGMVVIFTVIVFSSLLRCLFCSSSLSSCSVHSAVHSDVHSHPRKGSFPATGNFR